MLQAEISWVRILEIRNLRICPPFLVLPKLGHLVGTVFINENLGMQNEIIPK
jgi:hypothetical protein